MEWKHIGSGVFAKTVTDAEQLLVSGKGGPPSCEVARGVVRDLNTGKVIDDCVPEDTPDAVLFRCLPAKTDIRVKLMMRGASSMYHSAKPDVCNVFSA